MNVAIGPSWKKKLVDEFESPYFQSLSTTIRDAYLRKEAIYPPPKDIFRAFDLCPFEKVRVVILGQDPYHGQGQAHGLSFSVPDGIRVPPSLQNIYKELKSDLGIPVRQDGDLTRWAEQGVLLLNATLTVKAGSPGSHQGLGWETFTDAVVKKLGEEREHIVFMLWGRYAQDKGAHIDPKKHLILKAPHPSPFSAHTGFLGCKHFSQANSYLTLHGYTPIVW